MNHFGIPYQVGFYSNPLGKVFMARFEPYRALGHLYDHSDDVISADKNQK